MGVVRTLSIIMILPIHCFSHEAKAATLEQCLLFIQNVLLLNVSALTWVFTDSQRFFALWLDFQINSVWQNRDHRCSSSQSP